MKESERLKDAWEFVKKHVVSIGFCGAAGVAATGGDLLSASGLLIYAGSAEALNFASEDVAEDLHYRRIFGGELSYYGGREIPITLIDMICLFAANEFIIAGTGTDIPDGMFYGPSFFPAAVVPPTALYVAAMIKERKWYNADGDIDRQRSEFWERYKARHRDY